jgi:hypothetical protein
MLEFGSLLSFNFEWRVCANFKRSSILKYYKIMTGVLLLYVPFDIRGWKKWFWVDRFLPRYASDGATHPQNETMVFSLARPRTIILRAKLLPDICLGR